MVHSRPEGAVRMSMSKMNSKQVIKLTNSDVNNLDIRKLNNAGENFLTEIRKNFQKVLDFWSTICYNINTVRENLTSIGARRERR